jgi:hypothetical protein
MPNIQISCTYILTLNTLPKNIYRLEQFTGFDCNCLSICSTVTLNECALNQTISNKTTCRLLFNFSLLLTQVKLQNDVTEKPKLYHRHTNI